jgi:Tol biopolymer transport system component
MRKFPLACAAAALAALAHAQAPGLIIFTHAPEGGPGWLSNDVYTVHPDGSAMRALTHDGHSHHPSWSPDGKRILFIHDSVPGKIPPYKEEEFSKDHHPIELCVMDADGLNRRVLRVIEPVIHSSAWSPGGTTIAVSAVTSFTSGTALYLLPANGQGELKLLRRDAWTPAWSPDGTKLVFSVEQPRGVWSIHVINIDGTNDVQLSTPGSGGSPAWSPDGKHIAFDNGRGDVLVMNADGSGVRQLTTADGWSCNHPAWSAAGDALVVGCRSASSPCGLGIFSTGQPMPECTRRLFSVPITTSENAKAVMLTDHDGSTPSISRGAFTKNLFQ